MRPIKFRAWDKKANEMTYYESRNGASLYLTLNGVLVQCRHDLEYNTVIHTNLSAGYVLMQYTVLKDKNGKGKEVYAKDVIGLSGVHYKVFWDKKKGQWSTLIINKGVKGKHYKPLWEILSNSYSKVIGNRFENPKLLEQENETD